MAPGAAEAADRLLHAGHDLQPRAGDLFERVLAGLSELPGSVVVTVGREVDPEALGAQPAHVRVERFVRQARLLPHCDVVVSHGGSGSVLAALAHGLPMVLLPIGADQPLNAARCEALHVVRVLDPVDATAADVADAVSDVVSDPTYRSNSRRVKDEIDALPGAGEALRLLERLAAEKPVSPRFEPHHAPPASVRLACRPVRELQTGLWYWEARHPDWTPKEGGEYGWGPEVTSYAIEDGERLLLFDPLGLPGEIEDLAARGETAVVLTCPWHERDARSLVERLGARVFVPPPDVGNTDPIDAQVFSAGQRLPVGVEAFPGMEPNDLVLWVESRRALVVGDTLIDRGRGLEFPTDWANKGVPPEEILGGLRPLLELPVELVLPTHGAPADRAALERALS